MKPQYNSRWLALRHEVNALCGQYGAKKALSNLLGVPQSTMSKILHGPNEPRASVALILNDWLAEQKKHTHQPPNT